MSIDSIVLAIQLCSWEEHIKQFEDSKMGNYSANPLWVLFFLHMLATNKQSSSVCVGTKTVCTRGEQGRSFWKNCQQTQTRALIFCSASQKRLIFL